MSAASNAATSAAKLRPLLSFAEAEQHTIAKYLEKAGPAGSLVTDNWNPTAGVNLANVKPDHVVDMKFGRDSFYTIQGAVNAAVTAVETGKVPAATRQYILIRPGTYEESVFVPAGVTLTLYGENADASRVVITQKIFAGTTQAAYQAAVNPGNRVYIEGATPAGVYGIYQACASRTGTMGTTCSAGSVIRANGFEAKNLTWRNDFDATKGPKDAQAVALMVDGADKVVFDNVSFSSRQDTLYIKSSSAGNVNRAYFKNCFVEGDVDFIFGRSTAVFDNCTIHYRSDRMAASGSPGYLIAPSTAPQHPYGFLFINSKFTADGGTPANSIYLGRSWDEGRNAKERPYEHGTSPNGQAVIRNSEIGAHIRKLDPWGPAASTNRPFDSRQNRFAEWGNTGPGS